MNRFIKEVRIMLLATIRRFCSKSDKKLLLQMPIFMLHGMQYPSYMKQVTTRNQSKQKMFRKCKAQQFLGMNQYFELPRDS